MTGVLKILALLKKKKQHLLLVIYLQSQVVSSELMNGWIWIRCEEFQRVWDGPYDMQHSIQHENLNTSR